MWSFASNCVGGHLMPKKPRQEDTMDWSDDEVSSVASKEDGLECPICWESFNLVENIPYVLWCGHTLCKNCILGLHWAVVKFPTLPLQLPLFISCPWCNLLSFRLVYREVLRFPRKNFFLLWMLESINGGDRVIKSQPATSTEHRSVWASNVKSMRNHMGNHPRIGQQHTHHHHHHHHHHHLHFHDYLTIERLHSSLRKSLAMFVHLTAKFPLVIIFVLVILYVIPASVAILALYLIITIVFAVPSFLILYFSYPSLDWLLREIFT